MDIKKFTDHFEQWENLTENQKGFFCGDEYLPLPRDHAERVSVLFGKLAREFCAKAFHQIPEYKSGSLSGKRSENSIQLADVWNDEDRLQEVRQWLHDRGIPYSTIIYLLYDNIVVRTDWKFLLTYWDALAWNVGMAMIATDLSGQWACEFHHEEVITFFAYLKHSGTR